jgi:hypothetical protein
MRSANGEVSLIRLIALSGILLASPTVVGAQTPPSSSPPSSSPVVWANNHAKFVIQSVDGEGKLTGTYQNFGAGMFGCASIAYKVTGWLDGDRITYAVLRKDQPPGCNLGVVESWSGFIRGDELFVQFSNVFWNGKEYVARSANDYYKRQ